MSTAAVVVNFNAGEHLAACVRDLLSGDEVPTVCVIDNASTDGSAQRLQELAGREAGLDLVHNPDNVGFAPAVNAFAREAISPYIWVVNPDCRVPPNTLMLLRQALDAEPAAGLASPKVVDGQGRPEKAAVRRFPTPWKSLMTFTGLARLGRWIPALGGVSVPPCDWPDSPGPVEAVSGACMLIRREALGEVGFMDEDYGLHCEDLDLMYRLREAGWASLIVPEAEIRHEQGVSSRSRPLWVHRQKHQGMRRFYDKFQAPNQLPPVRWLVRGGICLRWLLLWPWVALRG